MANSEWAKYEAYAFIDQYSIFNIDFLNCLKLISNIQRLNLILQILPRIKTSNYLMSLPYRDNNSIDYYFSLSLKSTTLNGEWAKYELSASVDLYSPFTIDHSLYNCYTTPLFLNSIAKLLTLI